MAQTVSVMAAVRKAISNVFMLLSSHVQKLAAYSAWAPTASN